MRTAGPHVAGIVAIIVACGPAAAATYRAAPSGSGGACTAAKPCSLRKCIARVGPGDTCEAASGIYQDPPPLDAAKSCKASAPCTVKSAERHGAVIVVDSGGPELLSVVGNHWVIDGFLVRINVQRMFTVVHARHGFTWSNNRVEVRPGVGGEVLITSGTDDVVVSGNWVHHEPPCRNGGGEYGPCGRHGRCDFDTGNGDMFLFTGDGIKTPTSGLTFTGNDYGHWQNPLRVRNFANVVYSRNRCTNATNHGCIEANDVTGLVVENNVADIDTRAGCEDEILQSALFDTYCFADVVIRNNTSVGHGIGWEQQLACLAPNAGADKACHDGVAPEVGRDGRWYDAFRVYNNIVYDGKPSSGASGLQMNTGQASASPSPCCFSDHNLVHSPAGKKVGIDEGRPYVTFEDWQAHGMDAHGLSVAPRFADYAGHDYRAASGSAPQVDAGMGTDALPCPKDDFDGRPRDDGRCDIGAFEFRKGAP